VHECGWQDGIVVDVLTERTVPTMSRVALVTGGSRGIGAATSLVLAERGFRVVVNYRSSTEEADEVVGAVTSAGGEAIAIRADVTVAEDVDALVGEAQERWGSVDVLVHNALIPFDVTSFSDLTWEQLGGKLDREMRAAYLVTKAVVPSMISRNHGRLIYLSTGLSRRPREGMIALGVAKAALDQFTRYVALEMAPHGITANLVAPATVDETKVTGQLSADQVRHLGDTNPMGRLVRPDEVARTVAFLASDDAGFTTGHYLPVNGGLSME
jgi:3-oxoacyl-[acyl-carrier protein] reductase